MKRKRFAFLMCFVAIALFGCSDTKELPDEGPGQNQVQVSVNTSESRKKPEETVARSQKAEESDHTQPVSNGSLHFVLPKTYLEKGLSSNTDTDFKMLEDQFKEMKNFGKKGELTVQYTGYQRENKNGDIDFAFFLINQSETDLKNLQFNLTFGSENNPVFEKKTVTLREDEYGILKKNTVMPFYLTLKKKDQSAKKLEITEPALEMSDVTYQK